MFCGKCGRAIAEGQQFCTGCGTPVKRVDELESAAEAAGAVDAADAAEAVEQSVAEEAPLAKQENAEEPSTDVSGNADVTVAIQSDDQPTVSIPGAEAPLSAMQTMPVSSKELVGVDILVSDDAAMCTQGAAPAPGYPAAGAPAAPTAPAAPAAPVQQPFAPNTAQCDSVPYEEPSGQKKSSGKTVAIVVAVIAVIAVAAIAAVFALGLVPGSAPEAKGSEPTKCTHITRIHPKDDKGNSLTDYTVSFRDRKTGKEVATVTGDPEKGFSFSDAEANGNSLPDGEYTVRVHDNTTGNDYDYPIDVRENDPDVPEEVEVTPPAESSPNEGDGGASAEGPEGEAPSDESPGEDSDNGAPMTPQADRGQVRAQAYLEVVKSLESKHGKASVNEVDGCPQVEGVALVKLVDLDADEEDELMVGYYDKNRVDKAHAAGNLNSPDGYIIEIWDFDGKDAKKLYEHASDYTNGGFAFVNLVKDGKGYFLDLTSYGGKDGKTDMISELSRFTDGKVETTTFTTHDVYSSNPTYEIDDEEVTAAEYKSARKAAASEDETECFWFMQAKSTASTQPDSNKKLTTVNPDDMVKATAKSIAELEAQATGEDASSQTPAAITESSARDIVEKTGWSDILYVYAEDFDNDGATEAMVITGKKTEYDNEYKDGKLIFVTSSGDCYEPDFGSNVLGNRMNGLVRVGDYLLLSTEHDAHGSGTSSSVFAVKNGGIVQVTFSLDDTVGNYGDHPGQASAGYVNVFKPQGGHDYEWHKFTYDYATSTLVDQGVVDSPYGA